MLQGDIIEKLNGHMNLRKIKINLKIVNFDFSGKIYWKFVIYGAYWKAPLALCFRGTSAIDKFLNFMGLKYNKGNKKEIKRKIDLHGLFGSSVTTFGNATGKWFWLMIELVIENET